MTKPTKGPTPEQQSGLSTVAPGIYFVQGDETNRPADSTDPTLILLFGWMDAKLAHLVKYSVAYRAIYPQASQVVVMSKADIFLLPKFVLRRRMQVLVPFLTSLGVLGDSGRPHRILTHTFSNGGLYQLNYLSQSLPTSPTPNVLTSAFVVDSAPGGDDWENATHTFGLTIPNRLFRYTFYVFLFIVYTSSFLLGIGTRKVHQAVRDGLLKPNWLPWMSATVSKRTDNKTTPPFLYIYSKADRSVPYKHVQKFTELAESKGHDVTRLVFDTSKHVDHMRSNPDVYWNAVRENWAKALEVSGQGSK